MKTFKYILPIIACFISASTFAQNAIDLGLSVKWADRNLGAPTSFEYGGLYGWGDSSGNQKTENLNYYPTSTPPREISRTRYDIAHIQWGKGWRLPTAQEIDELESKCKFTFMTTEDGKSGFLATGPNGNCIFLPLSGIRKGNIIIHRNKIGYYWSGKLGSDTRTAHAFYLYNKCEVESAFFRYYGFSIRPVLDD